MDEHVQKQLALIRKKFLTPVIGAMLYASLVWLTTIFPLATAGDVNIRPGIVVPIFFGFAFGPKVGFFTGMVGNFLGDLFSGVVSFPLPEVFDNPWINFAAGTYLPWQLGNGLMGMVPGFARRRIVRFNTLKDYGTALLIAIVGIVVGMGVASILTVAVGIADAYFVFTQYFIPAVWSNIYNVILLLPVLLYNFEYLDFTAFKALRSKFIRRLLFVILGAAGLPIILLGLFLLQPDAISGNNDQGLILFKLLFTIILTMLFVIVNASMVAQRLSGAIVNLSDAAQLMETDQLSAYHIRALKETPGNDEISQLCRIFGQMAQETSMRQENMKRQIRQLHIKIDKNKTANEVASIVETDYFQQLERKVDELRVSIRL
ncbi:MAG: ECF transporter S component [Chloroflexi bacterium]|nr:ECF transporter S component [Chloroflexota bacterium]